MKVGMGNHSLQKRGSLRDLGNGPKDIWAVGYDNKVVHWDGSSWSTALSGTDGELRAAWGIGANDVRAVGNSTMHWDGSAWMATDLPISFYLGIYIGGFWGSSANDVWAVGPGDASGPGYVLHWDGAAWTKSSFVPPHGLNAIWGSGANDVWAVGPLVLQGGVILHHEP